MGEIRFLEVLMAERLAGAGEFVVYGRRLRALCLRASAVLTVMESPAWPVRKGVDAAALFYAARVCEAGDWVAPGENDGELARARAQYDFATELRGWCEYVRLCGASPGHKPSARVAGKFLNAPDELIVATYLLQHTRLSEERVWTMPLGLAHWYVAAVKEQRAGESDIVSAKDEEEMAREASADGEAAAEERLAKYRGIEERFRLEMGAAATEQDKAAARQRRLLALRDFEKAERPTSNIQHPTSNE